MRRPSSPVRVCSAKRDAPLRFSLDANELGLAAAKLVVTLPAKLSFPAGLRSRTRRDFNRRFSSGLIPCSRPLGTLAGGVFHSRVSFSFSSSYLPIRYELSITQARAPLPIGYMNFLMCRGARVCGRNHVTFMMWKYFLKIRCHRPFSVVTVASRRRGPGREPTGQKKSKIIGQLS
jgi:hypothetical protein